MSAFPTAARPPRAFEEAVDSLHRVDVRPEVALSEIPAPAGLAPWSVALAGDVFGTPSHTRLLGSGRLVLLHDPGLPEAWKGPFRIVTYIKAELEPEIGQDPLLAQVAWSWLVDCLAAAGAHYRAEAGTATRVLSESFGSIVHRACRVEVELRASWTPVPAADGTAPDLAPHVEAWSSLLLTVAGIPPLPPDVSVLKPRRRSEGAR